MSSYLSFLTAGDSKKRFYEQYEVNLSRVIYANFQLFQKKKKNFQLLF